MFTWRCPTCIAGLRNEHAQRCPVCHENLHKRPPIVVGADRADDWYRRIPWDRHTKDEIDAHFAAKPLPGQR